VVAVHRSQFSLHTRVNANVKMLVVLLSMVAAFPIFAQNTPAENQYFVVDVELQTADELRQLLERAELLMLEGVVLPGADAKVTLVLHGPVLRSLLRDKYRQNKDLVDQAASLSAMEVIDVKACNTWMTSNGVNPENLQPFVETVAYGPAEVKRLLNDTRYLNF
jgi:intracellular sulfur oxidation DsrE/DsrF family protein